MGRSAACKARTCATHAHQPRQERRHPGGFVGSGPGGQRQVIAFGKAQVNDLELVAALLLVADGAAHERGDTVELFLRPRLVSKQAHVSALAVFVGVVGGAAAFGGVGLIVGPVLLTLVSALLKFVEEMRLGRVD